MGLGGGAGFVLCCLVFSKIFPESATCFRLSLGTLAWPRQWGQEVGGSAGQAVGRVAVPALTPMGPLQGGSSVSDFLSQSSIPTGFELIRGPALGRTGEMALGRGPETE